jgi:hypothetical protein
MPRAESISACRSNLKHAGSFEQFENALFHRLLLRLRCVGAESNELVQRFLGRQRRETNRLAKIFDGVFAVALEAIGDAALVVGDLPLWTDADGLAVVRNGVVEVALVAIGVAAIW